MMESDKTGVRPTSLRKNFGPDVDGERAMSARPTQKKAGSRPGLEAVE